MILQSVPLPLSTTARLNRVWLLQGKSVGAVCCIDYLDDWENLNTNEYITRKQKVANIFIDRLEILIPGIRRIIEFYEVGTSSTIKRYTLNPGGAVYGFAQTPSRKVFDSFKLSITYILPQHGERQAVAFQVLFMVVIFVQ